MVEHAVHLPCTTEETDTPARCSGCTDRVDPFDCKPLVCLRCLLPPFGTTEVPKLPQIRFHKSVDIGTISQTTTETRIFSNHLADGKYSRILFWYYNIDMCIC